VEVVGVSRRPARETTSFAVALVVLATLGGVGAAAVASGAPDAGTASTATQPSDGATAVDEDATAPANAAASAPNGSFDYDGERIVVDQVSDQQITGTTSLENGSQVTVRIRSTDSQQPFLRQTVVSVDQDGSFAASVDFGNIERGIEFSVGLYYNGTELATAPGVVGGCDPTCGEPSGDATFGQNVYQGTAGEALEMTVELSDRDSAFVRFGEDDTGVTLPFTVTDGDGDGTVTVVLETSVDAPNRAGVSASSSADSVDVHDGVERPTTLDAADYDVGLYPNADASQQQAYDVGTVVLTEPTGEPATTRGGDSTTTVGTIYGGPSTSAPGGDGAVSMETMAILAVGGVLAVVGIAALVGAFD
jgi:hypothetical protein